MIGVGRSLLRPPWIVVMRWPLPTDGVPSGRGLGAWQPRRYSALYLMPQDSAPEFIQPRLRTG